MRDPFYKDASASLYHGDALSVLKEMETESVQCCVTSPPYWNMRDYDIDGQLGLEDDPNDYIDKMVEIFEQVRRVLVSYGTAWVNIGDCYASGGWGGGDQGLVKGKTVQSRKQMSGWRSPPSGFKHKDMMGIPWRVAFALQDAGWYLRQDIIWHKPNPMPESIGDRCTKSHEYIFLLSKSTKYNYDSEAIKERTWGTSHSNNGVGWGYTDGKARKQRCSKQIGYRNKRSVWTVPTYPYKGEHAATFPPNLIKPCILAGCPVGEIVLDPFTGTGTTNFVAKELGRKSIGIELNPKSLNEAKERLRQEVLAY